MEIALALAAAVAGLAGGWLALTRIRTGFHRYDTDGPPRALTWVVPVSALAAGATAYGLRDWAWPVGVTGAVAAIVGVALAAIDFDVHRLPRVVTWPCYPAVALLLTVCSAVTGDWPALLRALEAGAALWVLYYVLHRLARRRGLGRGDVTLAGVVGMLLGWFGWAQVAVATYLAFILAGASAALLLVLRRVSRSDRIAFGPAMIAAALVLLALQ